MALVPIKQYAEKNPYSLSYYMLRDIAEGPHGAKLFRRISERHIYVDTEELDEWVNKSTYFSATKRKALMTAERLDQLRINLNNGRGRKPKKDKKPVNITPPETIPVDSSKSPGALYEYL